MEPQTSRMERILRGSDEIPDVQRIVYGRTVMRKTIVALLLSITCLTGCSVKTDSDSARFVYIEGSVHGFDVFYDRTTGVEYAVSCGAYNYGTVTLLVDADGKPLIYKGEK